MNDEPDEKLPPVPAVLIHTKPADALTPKAGWFPVTERASATLAAQRAGYTVVEFDPRYADLVKAAAHQGELSKAGKLSLSAVKKDVLARLLANLAGEPVEAPDGSGKLPPGTLPTFVGSSEAQLAAAQPVDPLWAALTVNMVVLAPEYEDRGGTEGWFESIIVAIHGDVFTLRFRDYPRQPQFQRQRHELAIMYPPPVRV